MTLSTEDKLWLTKNINGGEPKYQMTYMVGPINVTVRLNDIEAVVPAVESLVEDARQNVTLNAVQKIEPPIKVTKQEQKCSQCGSDMWDNRPKKKSGEFKSNAPDFSCKNKECANKVWPAKT